MKIIQVFVIVWSGLRMIRYAYIPEKRFLFMFAFMWITYCNVDLLIKSPLWVILTVFALISEYMVNGGWKIK